MAWFLLASGGASFIKDLISTPTRRGLVLQMPSAGCEKVCGRLSAGCEIICYRLTAGCEIICYRLTAGVVKKFAITSGGASLLVILVCTPTRRGLTFVRAKVSKTRLGLRPKTPVAGCAGYGLIRGGSRNQSVLRTESLPR